MATPPYPEDEHSRQAYVDQLGLLEEGADEVFEEILAAVTSYFQTPIALISILDHQRQWFRASIGLDIRQTPRRDSFCAYAILGKGVFEVADATLDPRFRDNPYVQGEPRIRFYAGAPLATAEGLNLGSLCVIDREPRGPLAERDVAMLEHFARLVMARIHTLRSTNYIDEPTGLYNRLRLQEDVSLRLQRDGALTVIAADLLPLALLNTIIRTLGYPFSNDLMLEARDRIRAELPDFTLYKISPTRFGLLLPRQQQEETESVCLRLLRAFESPVVCRGIPIKANVGLGVLPLADDPLDGDQDWLRLVVSAADDARDRGVGWARYNPPLDQAQQRAFTLLTSLSQAIGTEEGFHLVYQPKIDLPTGRCTGVEALLRWRHPQLGFVSPAEFVPLAEKTALMRPLSDWVLRHTMAQLAQWNARNIPLRLAINVSASDMEDSSFLEEAVRLAKTYDIDLSALELEFTESVLIRDASAVGSVLLRARELGMGIAVDDFGTGDSNWTYLRDLPITAIKLDQSFTRDLAGSPKAQSVTQAVIGLASQLGYRVVAEGIETHDTFHLLQAWGCHEGQGYLIAQPMLPEQLEDWLRR
ncbi:TPA: sensor domain-containing phosphodiesterase [Pseudomonas aeruginosa]|nr:sensor domain-containing phosphodiesterase [Pseudomonas aeruginosa]